MLRQNPMRARYGHPKTPEGLCDGQLVSGVYKAEEETDGHRLDSPAPHLPPKVGQCPAAQWLKDAPVVKNPLVHPKTELLGHHRRRARGHQVVEVGPCLTSYLQHVFEAPSCDEGCPSAFALNQRVGCNRRAVGYLARRRLEAQLLESTEHRLGRVMGRREHLMDANPLVGGDHEVGEGATGVNAYANSVRRGRLSNHHTSID